MAADARTKRFVVGILILLLVDLIWVGSAGLTVKIYKGSNSDNFPKPLFTTYFKTCLFSIYLIAFLFWRPWQRACYCRCKISKRFNKKGCECPLLQDEVHQEENLVSTGNHLILEQASCPIEPDAKVFRLRTPEMMAVCGLSEPMFEPIKTCSDAETDRCSSISICRSTTPVCRLEACKRHKVKFCSEVEVRHLQVDPNEEDSGQQGREELRPLSVKETALLAFLVGIVWFFANYLYQRAFVTTSVAVVNTLSSVSGVFVMLLSALPLCSTSHTDKLTVTKILVVILSAGGAVLIGISKSQDHSGTENVLEGVLCTIGGACLYACYLVLLKKRATSEDRLELPMFFGFLGLFDAVVILPLVVIWHYSEIEPFEWPPSNQVWTLLLVNGFVGTVLSDLLWLWGCFLTTPLVATLSLSLVSPLSIVYSMIFNDITFSWPFFLGAVITLVAFVTVAILDRFGSWDPVWLIIKKLWCNDVHDWTNSNNINASALEDPSV